MDNVDLIISSPNKAEKKGYDRSYSKSTEQISFIT